MIIVRQRNYSYMPHANPKVGTDAAAALGKGVISLGKSAVGGIKNMIKSGKRVYKFRAENPEAFGRAIKLASIRKGKELEKIALNPGAAVSKGVELTLENPISATSQVLGNVALAVEPRTAAIPIGGIGVGIEQAIKRKLPKYARAVGKLADKYKKSRVPDYVEGGINGVVESLKSV